MDNENTKVMTTDDKIKELEERIAKLEAIEKKRRTKKIIEICVKLVFYGIVIAVLVVLVLKLKSYFDYFSGLKDLGSNLGFDTSSLKDFDLGGLFGGLFGQ